MTTNNENYSRTPYHDFILDNSISVNLSNITIDSSNSNTMYYTTPQGTLDTITLTGNSNSIWGTYQGDISSYSFPTLKEFEHCMPDLTKVEEMCKMYPAMEKAFENFKAIYNLTKDDYEERKNNGS